MGRWITTLGLAVAVIASGPVVDAADPAAAGRVARVAHAGTEVAAAVDWTRPEGRTRWDLTVRAVGGVDEERIVPAGASVVVSGATGDVVWSDPTGGDSARRWLLPHADRGALRMGTRDRLRVTRDEAGRRTEVDLVTEIVGIGWVRLNSGPREVVLQRAVETRPVAGDAEGARRWLRHRWIDPRAGVVAEIVGPTEDGGVSRVRAEGATFVESVTAGAADLVLYADEVDVPSFTSVLYGWDIDNPGDPGQPAEVRHLTPEQYATIGDLIAADAWDFSQNTSGREIASSVVDLVGAETCNRVDGDPTNTQCGFGGAGRQLGRQDVGFDSADPVKNNQVLEREDRAGDVTIWLRAGAQKEGTQGFFGGGESRFCYDEGRTPVPLWQFTHQDAGGFYMQPGDFWEPEWADPVNTPYFDCEQTLFNQICGESPGIFQPEILYAKPCNDHAGTQTGEVIKAGVVTVPSGHTLNALLVRTVGDFCVYSGSSCSDLFGKLDEARTVVYLWQVPHLGTVVLLQSVQEAPDLTSWSVLDISDIRFGLFPPLSIEVTGATDTTLDVSWDPGLDTHRIDGYRVYWDTDSGSSSGYANSQDVLGAANTSLTLNSLQPGTTYYVTVTSLSDYANPSRPTEVTTYESLVFPTQVSGDPDHVYPVEVQGTTTGGSCTPTEEIVGVSVARAATAGEIEICWQASTDACVNGYRVLGAPTPESDTSFAPLADVASTATCWTGDPGSDGYFLVVGTGTGGEGPWGHYGR